MLVRLMGAGGENCLEFDEFYRRYFPTVYRYLCSLCGNSALAEEITQATFFKALRHYVDYRGQCAPQTWLCGIARNSYFDHLRRHKRLVPMKDAQAQSSPTDTEAEVLRGETLSELHKALHQMEEPYREVFMLRVFGELSYKQMAEVFGQTENWCRVTYYRAKEKLCAAMRKEL